MSSIFITSHWDIRMKYVHYESTTGKILGWYDGTLHKSIPEPNLIVDDEDWEKAIIGNANFLDTETKEMSCVDFRSEAEKKIDALGRLNHACDKKTRQAKNYIAGKEVTSEQAQRYEEKYQIAKEYRATGTYADRLKLEADLQGLTIDELAELIVNMGDSYKEKLISFNARIEAFRIKASKLIAAGEMERVNSILEQAKVLGPDTTDEQIKALFNA